MYFTVSKLLGGLANPATVLGILILASGAASFVRRKRLSAGLLAAAVALIIAFGVLPVSAWLALPLEARFAAPVLPADIAGIIVLGGTERVEQSAAWGQPELSDPASVLALLTLGRRYPNAKLVFSGGLRSRMDANVSEAAIVRNFVNQLGASSSSIIYEDRSRNTYENALFTRELIKPKPGEHWILVCQAIGMPRAVGVFRKAGWDVIPFPAGYLGARGHEALLSFDMLGGFHLGAVAMHEWVGLIMYRVLGYMDEFFPG